MKSHDQRNPEHEQPAHAQIGRRIRALRTARKMSLTALAAHAGIGKGTLSDLETGNRNATLDTLYAVARPLQVTLAELLGEQPGSVVAAGTSDREFTGQGITTVIETTLLTSRHQQPGRVAEVYWLRMSPGGVHTSRADGDDVTEHLLVIRGMVRAGPVGRLESVPAGESTRWTSNSEHEYRAGDAGVEAVLTIVSGRAES